ncbi:rhodanese-like domain-containing protein [Kangiella aquimarina]|uniref:Rhodanese-like domain-containing protein n=1 Tax=Kangiella aquimarina TaxID=261965 RepID=A0ABZ0X5E1_9GAMM|nr:rhodanese-like domain-containing protein [Kangiella aquimarina]WQG85821.1 rhodanese-like domain-containing protein [Kangiella aquimarina]
MANSKLLENTDLPIIDLRPVEDFRQGHIQGATNLPLSEIEDCWYELPPKGSPLILFTSSDEQQEVKDLFERQQYPIEAILLAEDFEQDELVKDPNSRRLWRASPLLEDYIELIEQHLPGTDPLAFDIGCGSGRDSIFLGLHGFQVLAIDRNPMAMERISNFIERWQVDVTPIKLNCEEDYEQLIQLIHLQKPSLVLQCRYLHRPLLDLYHQHLPAGSMVAIHTFMKDAAKYGSPKKPAFLLEPGELANQFADWDILLDQIHVLNDKRPLSLFIARKPY